MHLSKLIYKFSKLLIPLLSIEAMAAANLPPISPTSLTCKVGDGSASEIYANVEGEIPPIFCSVINFSDPNPGDNPQVLIKNSTCGDDVNSIKWSETETGAGTFKGNIGKKELCILRLSPSDQLNAAMLSVKSIVIRQGLFEVKGSESKFAYTNRINSFRNKISISSKFMPQTVVDASKLTFSCESYKLNSLSFSGCPSGLKISTSGAVSFLPGAIGTYKIFFAVSNSSGYRWIQSQKYPSIVNVLAAAAHKLSLISPEANTMINSISSAGILFSGTCNIFGAKVKVMDSNNNAIDEANCNGSSFNKIINLSTLGEGGSNLKVELREYSDSQSLFSANTFLSKDATPARVSISSPDDGAQLSNATVVIKGECSEEGVSNVKITYKAVNKSANCTAGLWSTSVSLANVTEGENFQLSVKQQDRALNPKYMVTYTFQKNNTPPSVAILTASSTIIGLQNQSAFPVSGSCSAEGSIKLSWAGGTQTTGCVGNVWTERLNLSSLPQGFVNVTALLTTFSSSSTAGASVTYKKDLTIPVMIINQAEITSPPNSIVAKFSGTCYATVVASIIIKRGSEKTVSPCVDNTFNTVMNINSAPEGTSIYTLQIAAGSKTSAIESISLFKDSTPTSVHITSPSENSFANIQNQGAFIVSGDCSEIGENVNLSGASVGSALCMGGLWSKNIDLTNLSQGSFSLKANHIDTRGKTATESSRTFVKDSIAPKITVFGSSYVNSSNSSSYLVSGKCSDVNQIVTIGGDKSSYAMCTGILFSAYLDLSLSLDGILSFTAMISDAAGNPSVIENLYVTKKTNKPNFIKSPVLIAEATNGFINASEKNAENLIFEFSGIDFDEASYAIGPAEKSCTDSLFIYTRESPKASSISIDGNYKICVKLSDIAQNPNAIQSTANFMRDTINPRVSITSSLDITKANSYAYAVEGECSDEESIISIGGDKTATASCVSGHYSVHVDYSNIQPGSVSITSTAKDLAGNMSLTAYNHVNMLEESLNRPTMPIVSTVSWSDNQTSLAPLVKGFAANADSVFIYKDANCRELLSSGTALAFEGIGLPVLLRKLDSSVNLYAKSTNSSGSSSCSTSFVTYQRKFKARVPVHDQSLNAISFNISNNKIFYTNTTFSNGNEAYAFDLSTSSNFLLADINPGEGSSNADFFTPLNSGAIFTAWNSSSGQESYFSSGISGSKDTYLISDANKGSSDSFIPSVAGAEAAYSQSNIAVIGQIAVYLGRTLEGKSVLYATNGNEGNIETIKTFDTVKPIASGLFLYNGKAYFTAYELETGWELWETNGTASGTKISFDIYVGSRSSKPSWFTIGPDNKLYFAAYANGSETLALDIWRSDGTLIGTERVVSNICPTSGIVNPFIVTDSKIFTACTNDTAVGNEPWVASINSILPSTGSIVRDINPGTDSSEAADFTLVGGKIYFTATNGLNGRQLYISDGTASGTESLFDLTTMFYSHGALSDHQNQALSPSIANYEDKAFFKARIADGSYAYFISNGTASGTKELFKAFSPRQFQWVKGSESIFFLEAGDFDNNWFIYEY